MHSVKICLWSYGVASRASRGRTYLFNRKRMRSGVAARATASFGTCFFASAATLFSDAAGILLEATTGAPGSAVGSDIVSLLLSCSS